MNVAELVEFLQEQPQDLPVVFSCCSEQRVLEKEMISIEELCLARPDGWVQNKRPDMLTVEYLVLPGN